MHRGVVEAQSAGQGMGAEFIIRLPIISAPTDPQNGQSTPSHLPVNTFGRVLVVDDNRDAANSLAEILKLRGNTTQAAFDGQQALELGEDFRPNVVLLDIGMPKLNGYDAVREIRQQPWGREIVVVALTGWGKNEDRRRSSEAGFDGHLVKPVDLQQLNSLLISLLQRRK